MINNDFQERCEHDRNLPFSRHLQEDAENIDRKEWNDDFLDGFGHDVPKFLESLPQDRRIERRDSQSSHKGEHQRRHHFHHRWDCYDKEWWKRVFRCSGDFCKMLRVDQRRKDRDRCGIGEKSRQDGKRISENHGNSQHFPRPFAEFCNGRRDQSDDDERNKEFEYLIKQCVERSHDSHTGIRHTHAQHHAENDGNDNS